MKNSRKFKNKEIKYYIAIAIIVIAYTIASFFIPVDSFSKRITTVTALISAVAFWLQFKRTERLNESNYIKDLNNQFITNKDMTHIEHELELYFNQYQDNTSDEKPALTDEEISKLHLGLNVSRTSPECQSIINYLVYLESLAAIVANRVVHLEVITDLFAYRFFLAVNNPVIQECELLPYSEYYQGVFNLSETWSRQLKKKGSTIPMVQFCLSRQDAIDYKEGRYKKRLQVNISSAMGDDRKSDIARCIYQTDRFIYPEAFGDDIEKASNAIKRIIGMDGCLFDYKNMIVARYNGQVCGVCLMYDGTGEWDAGRIENRIGKDLMPDRIKEGFANASENYFRKIVSDDLKNDTVELVACSVDEGFRRKGIGRKMLLAMAEKYSEKTIILDVLCENTIAIRLYESVGFVKQGEPFGGFAPEGLEAPMCWRMIKKPGTSA